MAEITPNDLNKLFEENGTLVPPPVCPICDKPDPDGLEACAGCYNEALCEASEMKGQRDTAYNSIKALESTIFSLKRELGRCE